MDCADCDEFYCDMCDDLFFPMLHGSSSPTLPRLLQMPQHNASINRQASGGASRPQATVSTGWSLQRQHAQWHNSSSWPEALLACVASLRQILNKQNAP